jgi:beta-1,4-mannosyl-glycoprotein beta-1,4-N-acetylglucosaminyltransferase
MFNNELDLLEIKLEELYNFVDKFVIIESTHSHAGIKKELHYTNNQDRFKKYEDKIINLVCNFSDTDMFRSRSMIYKTLVKNINDVWCREYFQRDFGLISGQIDFKDDDILIVTDLDEVVDKYKLSNFIKVNGVDKIYRLEMIHNYFKFNLKLVDPYIWRHSYICKFKHLKEFHLSASFVRHDYKFTNPEYFEILLPNMGWHFSFVMSQSDILNNKLKNYAHAYDAEVKDISQQYVSDCVTELKTLIEGISLEQYPIERLPKSLQKNKNNYKQYFI